ncbi:hypothetical protein H5410_047653 [Solanum commersonii]|uniref:Protein TIFY n=1 Tax=Solanum commersonii TaxID=4109 RepID=A0A9J5XFS1_SOLCO|nr:hypothetical protein H5410_047653 [Solanum commersonii]
MSLEETVYKSPLDKPLYLLTDDDISQLTREDCRRYLKAKGMRKPSWNKSQAIQQVISLKALLETTPDSDTGQRKRRHIPRPDTSLQRVQKETGIDAEFAESAEEMVPYGRKPPNKPDLSGNKAAGSAAVVNNLSPSRTTDSGNASAGQLIIFYCGKVNVYDDVPAEKAQAIMHLAASPLFVPSETPLDATRAAQHSECHLQSANVKMGPDSPMVLMPTMQTEAVNHVSRKALLERYREKRKDRFKRKMGMPSSASLDIYLNHRTRNHTPSELSSRSNTCSPPAIRLSVAPAPSGSMDNILQMDANASGFLDDKDGKE